jgi:hypothetical protein
VVRGLALAIILLSACATAPAPAPQADPDPRSTARPGEPPPTFPPSGLSDAELPITSNAYGAFAGAPHAPALGDVATFSLAEARRAGPVLVMFYRGFW